MKRIPAYASDVKININSCFEDVPDGITKIQLYGMALTAGYLLKNEELLNDIRSGEAKIYLEDSDAKECKWAAINISAYSTINVYEESLGVKKSSSPSISKGMSFAMPESLKVDEINFMMYSLVASIIYRCPFSIKYCCKRLKDSGVSQDKMDFAAKLTATLCSAYETLEIETLRSYDFITREESF